MSAENRFEVDGVVTDKQRGGVFVVKLENGHEITCTLSGKLRMNMIRVLTGDKVTVDMSPYDLNKGRIIWRYV